jgi:hypothetical protein
VIALAGLLLAVIQIVPLLWFVRRRLRRRAMKHRGTGSTVTVWSALRDNGADAGAALIFGGFVVTTICSWLLHVNGVSAMRRTQTFLRHSEIVFGIDFLWDRPIFFLFVATGFIQGMGWWLWFASILGTATSIRRRARIILVTCSLATIAVYVAAVVRETTSRHGPLADLILMSQVYAIVWLAIILALLPTYLLESRTSEA